MRWTLQNLHEPVFELFEAGCLAATPDVDRMPQDAVRNWVKRGFLNPRMGKRGKKDVRLYSLADLLKIFVASALTSQHTSLTASFIAGEILVERLEAHIKSNVFPVEVEADHWLVFQDDDGSTERFHDNEETNFWLLKSFIHEGKSYPPLIPYIDWSFPSAQKQEVFNADALIRKFVLHFYKLSSEIEFEKKLSRFEYSQNTDEFTLAVENFVKSKAQGPA